MPADEPLNLQIDGHAFRRVEVMTGSPRRRNWSWEQKAQIVSESLSGVRPVSELALRYGVHRNQIYNWRRELSGSDAEGADSEFVTVRMAAEKQAGGSEPQRPTVAATPGVGAVILEIELGGGLMRVRDGADPALVRTAIAALGEVG